MAEFTGQKVIVTGATRGLGRAISLAFLQAGATVVGVYGGNAKTAENFRQECMAYGGLLQLYQCDVSDYQAVEQLYGRIEQEFDTIDILVNNAGIRRDSVLAMMKEDDWRRVIDVNLTGSYIMAKFAVQLMMKQKYGRIIFITSPMAHMGFAGQANYAASKAGQIGMMKSLSKETAKRKITVNCVSPGFIATELIDDLSPEQLAEYKNMVPMRRFGTPDEVADAVLFLAGPKASYINGAVLDVNGGL
ncbi:MAG: 3-oxoacyl-ACP reductase FabG [Thermodesulfobacteriota bacterium]